MAGHSPTVRRRRLAAELRRLRGERDLTIDAVAQQLGWHATKLSRIETGSRSAPPADVRALLALYAVDDAEAEELMVLARQARQRGWWEAYKDVLPSRYSTYIGLEAEAESLCSYESLFLPGLLQTEDYARAVIRGALPMATEEEVENRVAVRIARQRVLTDGLRLWAIMDEAALRRNVDDDGSIMAAQADHIAAMAHSPTVTAQVIPYTAGPHPGMHGSFGILKFPAATAHDVIYVETMAGDLFLEGEADIKRYTAIFEHLRAVALSPYDSLQVITKLARAQGARP